MSFDVERIEEAARKRNWEGSRVALVEANFCPDCGHGNLLHDHAGCATRIDFKGSVCDCTSTKASLASAQAALPPPISCSELLALVEVVKAAREIETASFYDHACDCNRCGRFRSALEAFGDEQGSSSGGVPE